ncbi:MAG: hypothetical protein LBC29_04200 [Propionibacteriaceae bacterium]|jgi:hypothetical protein|nr:hypothetical protein [Propionibacteriaceae bacterium]
MVFPSYVGGVITQEVGWFRADANSVAVWHKARLDKTYSSGVLHGVDVMSAGWLSLCDAVEALEPHVPQCLDAFVPVGVGWCMYLNNSPRGTATGSVPADFARDGMGMSIRSVHVADSETRPIRILTVHRPGLDVGALNTRLIWAGKGEKDEFRECGVRFDFELETEFVENLAQRRFDTETLYRYLECSGVPYDQEPQWDKAVLVTLNKIAFTALNYHGRPQYWGLKAGLETWLKNRDRISLLPLPDGNQVNPSVESGYRN